MRPHDMVPGGDITLVIDDGPSANTGFLLDLLERAGHRAVLFILGTHVKGREAVLVDAIRRGFALGNHSFSHPHFSEIGIEQARAEIERTDTLIESLYARAGTRPRRSWTYPWRPRLPWLRAREGAQRPGKWFRFPYLDTGGARHDALQALLKELGFTLPEQLRPRLDADERSRRDWPSTLITRDWECPSETDFRRTVREARTGEIFELHDLPKPGLDLYLPLIEELGALALTARVPGRSV